MYRPDPDLLRKQLNSIAAQSFTDWTCHVGIDGPDAAALSLTREIVGDDARFVLHTFGENVGFFRNFERLVCLISARARWFALADQDDYWYPTKLSTLLDPLKSPDVMSVSGQARVVDRSGSLLSHTKRRETDLVSLLLNNQITGSLTIFRREILKIALPFPIPTDVAYHDHWLGVTARSLGATMIIDSVVQDYVQHEANSLGEEMPGRFRKRLTILSTRATETGGMLRYLAENRWEWRVRMAKLIIDRVSPPPSDEAVLQIANGQLRGRVALKMFLSTIKHEAPPGRILALLIGACGWRNGGVRPEAH